MTKINRIHVYIGFSFSDEKTPSRLQSILQNILREIYFGGEMSYGPMGLVFNISLQPNKATDLIHQYQQVISAFKKLYTTVDEDIPDLWQVSMAASVQPLAIEEKPIGDQLPGWILREFGSALILDSFIYSYQSNKDRFKQFQGKPVFYIFKPEMGVLRVKVRPERQLRKMRNIDPDASPQKIPVKKVLIEDLPQLAEIAYGDISVTAQIGGRALLLSFSLEQNSHMVQAEKGTFTFYNAPALGLKYHTQPNSLADHIQRGKILVLEAIAEPSARWEE